MTTAEMKTKVDMNAAREGLDARIAERQKADQNGVPLLDRIRKRFEVDASIIREYDQLLEDIAMDRGVTEETALAILQKVGKSSGDLDRDISIHLERAPLLKIISRSQKIINRNASSVLEFKRIEAVQGREIKRIEHMYKHELTRLRSCVTESKIEKRNMESAEQKLRTIKDA